MYILLLLVLIFIPGSVATYGVDVSQAISVEAFKCLKANGYSFAVPRVYQEIGKVDPNGAQTIKNAWAAEMAHVDGYIFPCVRCGNPSQQVIDTVNHLRQEGAEFGMLWFDIEGSWGGTPTSNVAFIGGLINQADAMRIKWGIYTSRSQWGPITNNSPVFGPTALWYPHYDNNPSFSDFAPFGGWSHPSIKQFQGTTTICGVGIDKNFY